MRIIVWKPQIVVNKAMIDRSTELVANHSSKKTQMDVVNIIPHIALMPVAL